MGNNTMVCDYCGEEHRYVPIIEKPKRFGYKGEINYLPQINSDGRTVDNVCLSCLSEEIQIFNEND